MLSPVFGEIRPLHTENQVYKSENPLKIGSSMSDIKMTTHFFVPKTV